MNELTHMRWSWKGMIISLILVASIFTLIPSSELHAQETETGGHPPRIDLSPELRALMAGRELHFHHHGAAAS